MGHLKPIAPPTLKPLPKPIDKGPKILKPIAPMTKEHIEQHQNKPIRAEDLLRPQQAVPVIEVEDDEDKKDKKRAIPGREDRQKKRNARAVERKTVKTG